MTTSSDLEIRRARIEKWVKVLGLGVFGFLFAPFALATITGLISLVIVSVIGLLVVNVGLPWFAVSLANWRLKALKAAAALNPIETLENQYGERQNALLKIRDNIKQSYAVLQTLYSQIQEHNEKYPNKPSQFIDKYSKLKQLVELRGKKYKQAQVNLLAFSNLIEEKRSDWKIAQTMAEASKLANVGEDFQSKLLKDTALNTIQDGLNLAFSELETSLLDEQTIPVATMENSSTTPTQKLTLNSPPNALDLGFDADSVIDVEAECVPLKRNRN